MRYFSFTRKDSAMITNLTRKVYKTLEIKQILSEYWGYSSFRPLQEEIITSVLDGNDTIALLPTGGGKSVCFQVPGLAREGVCIVISPLIALMKDQVQNLKSRGIKAAAVYSGMHSTEIDITIDNCIYGDIKFLYMSPERLTTDIVRMRLPKMKVNLVAIDEAHCISQWGYDFRPPYLKIAEIKDLLPETPFLALTATATEEVIHDIGDKLQMKNRQIFRQSFERSNLVYAVLKEENKLQRLLKVCNNVKGTGIVYVRNRRKTREISDFLNKNKIPADFYHAGLDAKTRDARQEAWIREKVRVIVSTNAFGMGIDKPNVRFVVHMDLPDTPEAYFQEAGRGGRDQKKAYAVLLFNQSDVIEAKKFIETSYPPLDFIKNVYNAVGNYLQLAVGSGKNKRYNFNLNEFCNHFALEKLTTYNALKILEKEGYIALSEAFAHSSKIHFYLNKEELYRFQVANPLHDQLIKTILRSYTGLFTEFVKITEKDLAKRINRDEKDLVKQLRKLHQLHVIYYEPQNTRPQIVLTEARADIKYISISGENYRDRKIYAEKRLHAMLNYIQSENRCRSVLLLEYFGEKNIKPCGRCDVCLKRNKATLEDGDFQVISKTLKTYVENENLTIEQLLQKLPDEIPEKKALMAIYYLIDNGKIVYKEKSGEMQWTGED